MFRLTAIGFAPRARQSVSREARLERADWPRLLSMAAFGAVLGPVALALLSGEPLAPPDAALGLVAVGATGYGLSPRFYLLAQRGFGAARTATTTATAPTRTTRCPWARTAPHVHEPLVHTHPHVPDAHHRHGHS